MLRLNDACIASRSRSAGLGAVAQTSILPLNARERFSIVRQKRDLNEPTPSHRSVERLDDPGGQRGRRPYDTDHHCAATPGTTRGAGEAARRAGDSRSAAAASRATADRWPDSVAREVLRRSVPFAAGREATPRPPSSRPEPPGRSGTADHGRAAVWKGSASQSDRARSGAPTPACRPDACPHSRPDNPRNWPKPSATLSRRRPTAQPGSKGAGSCELPTC